MGDNDPTVLEVFDGFMKGFVGEDYDPILEENQGGRGGAEEWAEDQLRKRGEHPDQKPSTADVGGSVDLGEGVDFPERPKPEDFGIGVDNEAREGPERGNIENADVVDEMAGERDRGRGGPQNGRFLSVDQLYEQNRINPLEAEKVERAVSGERFGRSDIIRLQEERVIEGNLKHRLLELLEAEGVEMERGDGQDGGPVSEERSAVSDGPGVSDIVQKLRSLQEHGELSEMEKQQILKALGVESSREQGQERSRSSGRDPDVEKLDEMLKRFK